MSLIKFGKIGRACSLSVGEIIGSGAIGCCCVLELCRLLADSDVIELDVSRIEVL